MYAQNRQKNNSHQQLLLYIDYHITVYVHVLSHRMIHGHNFSHRIHGHDKSVVYSSTVVNL